MKHCDVFVFCEERLLEECMVAILYLDVSA